jgi:thiol:disulfide interchange protein DsbD
MFGLYELQMPGFIQTALTQLSNSQRSGKLIGAGIMGALSALIVGPCITAPLVAALIVVGQSGDPVRGGTALFALGLGMGLPLLVVGTSAAKLMPKVGPWMQAVKAVFGVQLLGVAVWFLSRILPGPWTAALWAALIAFGGAYLAWLFARTAQGRMPRLLTGGAAFAAVVYAAMLLESALHGGQGFLAPFNGFPAAAAGTAAPFPHVLPFKRIKTVADLDRELALASARHQGTMLDFYADWCVACKEMEHDSFPDAAVKAALTDAVLLQADVTANDDADQALYTRFKIYGPPSIMFFGPDGKEAIADRVVGYLSPTDFTVRIRDAFARQEAPAP